jgi:hypothetical protein
LVFTNLYAAGNRTVEVLAVTLSSYCRRKCCESEDNKNKFSTGAFSSKRDMLLNSCMEVMLLII